MKLTGDALAEQRQCLGVTQAEMAKRTGLTRATIIKYEGKENFGPLQKILEAYELEITPLYGIIPGDLKDISKAIEASILRTTGMKCHVKINIEIDGSEEE